MPTRDIVCISCGFTGVLDIHNEKDLTPNDRLFRHLGHDPYSGNLHYRCPACNTILLVDPVAVLGDESLKGFPGMVADLMRQKSGYRTGQQDLFQWFNQTVSRA